MGATGSYSRHPKVRAFLRMKPKEKRADRRRGNQQILVDIFFEQLHATVTEVNVYYMKRAILFFLLGAESWLSVV